MSRRVVLTAKQKIAVLNDLKTSKDRKTIAAKYKVSLSTISRIQIQENKIRAITNPNRKRDRKGAHVNLDRTLLSWFNQIRSQNGIVTGPVLLSKAQEFALKLNESYVPDRSWLQRWCGRNALNFSKIYGEAGENNATSAEVFTTNRLPHIIEKFSPDCIFNADETGLYYKALPNGSYKGKYENPKGFKTQKQRLTFLFLCNATGTYKRAYCIGKSAKPRSFKGKQLPLPYYNNRSAWMTSVIWKKILIDLNQNLEKDNKQICLIVDNAPCHNTDEKFSNITIEFLPPNTTALIQPLDQGIIHSFKMEYRQILIKKQICALEKGLSIVEFLKSLTILDGINYANRAWNLVKQQTISNCFKKAGIDNIQFITDEIAATEGENYEWCTLDNEYIQCDNELVCFGTMSDEDIVADVLAVNQNSTEDEEVFAQSEACIKHPSTKNALLSLDSLRDYFCHNNIDPLEAFEDIENLILESSEKQKCQKKITDFLSKS
ncbi:tigger transposable element-derived protein 6-like [Zeugodacus cucurbitae]|nr:tigger transposable element-derived protein 6-like [Zeugodacus cucurbitae]XP_054085221.1 tigger transposable element-derived protein 6-like [Zeugodacus cucurbitae]XP_054085310.1 tigger transposable element-derived protein 6-like [Zeugodacus cucurbitae]XP_054088291.1 tigger transposable element-derived protein 6-like [Zeugodacus cucurbitae]